MNNEIQLPYGTGLDRGPGGYTFRRDNYEVYRAGAIALGKLETLAHVTWVGIEHMVRLETERRKLVGDDPVFHAATAPFMSAWLNKAREIQAGLYPLQHANPYYGSPQNPAQYGGQW